MVELRVILVASTTNKREIVCEQGTKQITGEGRKKSESEVMKHTEMLCTIKLHNGITHPGTSRAYMKKHKLKGNSLDMEKELPKQ
ncbi:unnamed protein product [Sphenostylis stenocarpa]|uniref:Uncharacterized protein n=1 Tax=Sphenostylis stenocarpa TaxID=92480 RepID=A0AA86SL87_9FABA|nr:unnamed protein product [Sphenostylis stenocarpa]